MEEPKLVLHNVGDGLGVSGGPGSAAPDCVVYSGELVGYTVGNVCASRCAGIGSEDNAVFECDRHTVIVRMLGGVLAREWSFGQFKTGGLAYIEVPKLRDGIVRMTPIVKAGALWKYHLLDLTLLQPVHINMDAICKVPWLATGTRRCGDGNRELRCH